MERDMALAIIQAQLAHLTAQLTHNAERTTMPSVPTFDVPYGQGYQSPQFYANEDVWGYQGHNQSRGNIFSNAYNSDWRGNSDYMWDEPQQFQQGGYWQQDEFYSRPMQPSQHSPQQFQSNQSMPMNYNEILEGLISVAQGLRKEEQLPPSEEFYQWPYEPSQPPQQSTQFNSGTSLDNDTLNKLLTSLNQGVENQNQEMQDRVKRVDELEMQVGQIVEFMAQIRDQSDMKDEAIPEPSKHSPNMDELLLQAEEEGDDLGSLEEFLLQAPQIPISSNSGEGVLNSLHSNDIPPNVLFPSRFLIPKQEESEKDIVEALPKVQKDIPILGATKQVLDRVEYFKGLCFPRRTIQENEVVEADQEFIQGAVHETIKPKSVEFDDPGQATTIIVDLAKFKVPEMFKDVVFVNEFAPTLEFKPLPNHFKYHLPLKDKFHALEPRGV
ncbi:hypothetical protein ACFX2G_012229 [Malus domestica]